jgi:hypothetical protein
MDVQGHCFIYDNGILAIKFYDMIFGVDWLTTLMWIHSRKKLLRFTYHKQRIVLRGVNDEASKCSQVSAHKQKDLLKKKAVIHKGYFSYYVDLSHFSSNYYITISS